MLNKVVIFSVATLIYSSNVYAVDAPVVEPETPTSQTIIYETGLNEKINYNQALNKDINASSENDLKELIRNMSVLDDPDAKKSQPQVNVKDKKKVKEFLTEKLGTVQETVPQIPEAK